MFVIIVVICVTFQGHKMKKSRQGVKSETKVSLGRQRNVSTSTEANMKESQNASSCKMSATERTTQRVKQRLLDKLTTVSDQEELLHTIIHNHVCKVSGVLNSCLFLPNIMKEVIKCLVALDEVPPFHDFMCDFLTCCHVCLACN